MTATHLRRSFPAIRLALVVGICGGVPDSGVLLGDVVLSDGVVQYDFGHQLLGRFRRKDTLVDSLGRPRFEIRAILAKIRGRVGRKRLVEGLTRQLSTSGLGRDLGDAAQYPGAEEDRLFEAAYRHKHGESTPCAVCSSREDSVCDVASRTSCRELGCDEHRLVARPRLKEARNGNGIVTPAVHFGLVASGNSVLMSGELRDEISRETGAIAFEMEGAGVWDIFPCVIIKGVCDYADSHKNKSWQNYAAATAAACMKACLAEWNTAATEGEDPQCIIYCRLSIQLCPDTEGPPAVSLYHVLTPGEQLPERHFRPQSLAPWASEPEVIEVLDRHSPTSAFETLASFYPERYTTDRKPLGIESVYQAQKALALSRLSLRSDSAYKICLIHAETPRRWRRITLSFPEHPDVGRVASTVQVLLSTEILFFDTVTNISGIEVDKSTRRLRGDKLCVTEDAGEQSFDRAASFVAEVDDIGCRQFVESEVAAISAISGHEYNSWVEGRQCIEKKLSFALNGDDVMSCFYEGFFANIAALHALRHSKGVVQLLGVVLDDRRQQVKSYLTCGNEFGTVGNILHKCNVAGVRIPRSVRLSWARDIISATADIHSQSLVVGRCGTWNLVLDRDGRVRRKAVDGNVCLEFRGWAAPEVRPGQRGRDQQRPGPRRGQMTAKTDLFQLGLELWLLARHEPGYAVTIPEMCCRESGCAFRWHPERWEPRERLSRCEQAHADPVALPRCGADVPACYQNVVDICRCAEPGGRYAARRLLRMLPREGRGGRERARGEWGQVLAMWPAASTSGSQFVLSDHTSWWRPREVVCK